MKVKDCKGKLIVVDMYSCNEAVINNVELVKEELNVKSVVFESNLDEYMNYSLKGNL